MGDGGRCDIGRRAGGGSRRTHCPACGNYHRSNGSCHCLRRIAVLSYRNRGHERHPVKTLEMRDPTGGFGVIRVLTTPDGQYFAYGTLRQLSELYLLQGLN
jgi:hypothetical protein